MPNERKARPQRRKKKSKKQNTQSRPTGKGAHHGVRQPKGPGYRIVPQLSNAARSYAMAIRDPRDATPCCTPASFPLPSYKCKTYARGTLSVGSAGFGSININPHNFCKNDAGGGTYTSSTATAFTNQVIQTGDVGSTDFFANAPYATAAFAGANPVQARLVGCALYAWYIGSELNLQGEFVGISYSDNTTTNHISGSNVLADPTSLRVPITSKRGQVCLSWCPSTPTDWEFNDQTYNNVPSIGLIVSGAASTTCIAWEAFAIVEYIGNAVPNRTLSSADPEGQAAVLAAAESQGTSVYENAKTATAQMIASAAGYVKAMSGPTAALLGQFAGGFAKTYMNPMGGPRIAMPPGPLIEDVTEEEAQARRMEPMMRKGEYIVADPSGKILLRFQPGVGPDAVNIGLDQFQRDHPGTNYAIWEADKNQHPTQSTTHTVGSVPVVFVPPKPAG